MLKARFWIDFFIFTGFLIALEPHFTGKSLHEWLTVTAVGTLIIHFLFHWDWFLRTSSGFFKNIFHISRLNYLIAIVIFIGFVTIVTSGLVISRTFLPALGLHVDGGRGWKSIHELASDLTLLAVALHFALHWDWIRNTFAQMVIQPFRKQVTPKKEAGHV